MTTGGDVRKRIENKVRALTDRLHSHGRPSPSPSVSATETARWPDSSRSAARDIGEGIVPSNQSSHQAPVPTPIIRVSSEHQLSSVVASANVISLTEKNRPLTLVRTLTPLAT